MGNVYRFTGCEDRPLGRILGFRSNLRGIAHDHTVELCVLPIRVLHVERPGCPGGQRAVRVVEQPQRLVARVRDGGDNLE